MKIIVCGASGKMGKELIGAIQSGYCSSALAAATDIMLPIVDCPAYTDIFDIKEDADVIIDFSHPAALDNILAYAIKNNVAFVAATTGYTDEQIAKIKDAAKKIPVFFT